MKFISNGKGLQLFTILIICNFSFSQNAETVIKSLQKNWDLCHYVYGKNYCGSNPNRQECNYQIKFKEDRFILYKNFKKIDTGKFEIEHHFDQVSFINFYSSLNDEILEILGTDTIKLFTKKEESFILFIENRTDYKQNLYTLKKTKYHLEN